MFEESEAMEALLMASRRDPRQHSWGYFDSFSAAGVEDKGFFWFEDSKSRLDFVLEVTIPFSAQEIDSAFLAHARRKFAEVDAGNLDSSHWLSELNENLLRPILWWGTFDDLLNSDGDFERSLRAKFQRDDNREPTGDPVLLNDAQALLDFIKDSTQPD